MRDPEAKDREYDPDEYWKDPGSFADKGLKPAYWNDPHPKLQGVLTSEHIRTYHEAVGRMIRPFDPNLLKTASYELTLGARHMVEGKECRLSVADPKLVLPPNSLSFVSMQQVLLLPHYLVGRFDLAIEFIYQGLLLGTGPQVDPGFQGALSCPLHNISNEPIEIEMGKSFAKIDFAKTVPRPAPVPEEWRELKTELELARWIEDQPDSSYTRVFKSGRPEWRRPIFGYVKNKRPTSSVKKLDDLLTKTVTRFQRIAIGGAVAAAVTVLVGVPAVVFEATEFFADGKADSSTVTALEHKSAVQDRMLRKRIKELEALAAEQLRSGSR
jgi:deoxycytidine triphosphate deaminase